MIEFGYYLLGFIGAVVTVMIIVGILVWWGVVIYRFIRRR